MESKHGSEEPEPRQPPATAPRTSSGVVRRPHSRTTSTRQRSAALRHSPLYVAHGEIAAGKNLLCLRADITPTFIRTDTPADGNCFFHGASMGLFGHWDHNHVLRNRVADEIEAHPARYQLFKPLNEHQLRKINLPRDHVSTFADLVRYSRTPGCWAFGPHQEALQKCFPEIQFSIWQPLPLPLHPWELLPEIPRDMLTTLPTSANVWQRTTLSRTQGAVHGNQVAHRREIHLRFTKHGPVARNQRIPLDQCNHYEAFSQPPAPSMLLSFNEFEATLHETHQPPNPAPTSRLPPHARRRRATSQRRDISSGSFPD